MLGQELFAMNTIYGLYTSANINHHMDKISVMTSFISNHIVDTIKAYFIIPMNIQNIILE